MASAPISYYARRASLSYTPHTYKKLLLALLLARDHPKATSGLLLRHTGWTLLGNLAPSARGGGEAIAGASAGRLDNSLFGLLTAAQELICEAVSIQGQRVGVNRVGNDGRVGREGGKQEDELID